MFKFQDEKQRLIAISFGVSVLLLVIKFVAFFITGSNAILSDALESIINVVASGFALYSIYLSALPKDENHPYGHGKIEFFSSGLEGALIVIAAFFIGFRSIEGLIDPSVPRNLPFGLLLIALSTGVNFVLGLTLIKRSERLNSITIKADGKHILTDAWSSLVLLLGVVIVYLTGWPWLDSALSLAFAFFILYSGFQILKESISALMDESSPKMIGKVVKSLNKNRRENWIDVHNLRVLRYGGDHHVDCHLTLPYYFTLTAVHDEVEEMERILEKELPGVVEVFIHADPCLPDLCCQYCNVADCAVRKYSKRHDIPWTSQNMAKNQKHYHEAID
ncbi:cation diffusion facilitator family transporter [Penaeicola halotolerans]|uniref:cation diffusion facilitator family transporter n=1 Tax=Penaeicola halotolerans TaxID=2793196 RepID=UPI001CF81CC1|nr:cation diffusion facilitator family transporter [Penaeicola halotolerans]